MIVCTDLKLNYTNLLPELKTNIKNKGKILWNQNKRRPYNKIVIVIVIESLNQLIKIVRIMPNHHGYTTLPTEI